MLRIKYSLYLLVVLLLASCLGNSNSNKNRTSPGDVDIEQPPSPGPGSGEETKVENPDPGDATGSSKPNDQPEIGRLLCSTPDSMQVGKVSRVEARIGRGLMPEQVKKLTYKLKKGNSYSMDTIETGKLMRIILTEGDTINPKFSIIALNSDDQIIRKNGVGYWAWNVKPLVPGLHTLTFSIGLIPEGQKDYSYSPVWDEQVSVTAVEGTGTNWLPIAAAVGLLLALLAVIVLWRAKSGGLMSLPPIEKEKLEAVEDLLKEGKLPEALDEIESLVRTVRDKEHNLIVSYKAELASFTARYHSGEISYEELGKVQARIRRAIVEMNDRLGA